MCSKLNNWLKELTSDAKGLPSTRLVLSLFMFVLLSVVCLIMVVAYVINKTSIDNTLIITLCGSITTMSGLSIVDKGGKNDKKR